MSVSSMFRYIIVIIIATVAVINIDHLNPHHHHVSAVPVTNSNQQQQTKLQTSANEPTIKTTNSNVYGADNGGSTNQSGGGGTNGQQQQKPNSEQNPGSVNRGYNQGYSYNTGIKPYRTGYTYFQPFGDHVNNQNDGKNGNNNGNGGLCKRLITELIIKPDNIENTENLVYTAGIYPNRLQWTIKSSSMSLVQENWQSMLLF